jgi:hypothetical protein
MRDTLERLLRSFSAGFSRKKKTQNSNHRTPLLNKTSPLDSIKESPTSLSPRDSPEDSPKSSSSKRGVPAAGSAAADPGPGITTSKTAVTQKSVVSAGTGCTPQSEVLNFERESAQESGDKLTWTEDSVLVSKPQLPRALPQAPTAKPSSAKPPASSPRGLGASFFLPSSDTTDGKSDTKPDTTSSDYNGDIHLKSDANRENSDNSQEKSKENSNEKTNNNSNTITNDTSDTDNSNNEQNIVRMKAFKNKPFAHIQESMEKDDAGAVSGASSASGSTTASSSSKPASSSSAGGNLKLIIGEIIRN